jgi:hypothetical protein
VVFLLTMWYFDVVGAIWFDRRIDWYVWVSCTHKLCIRGKCCCRQMHSEKELFVGNGFYCWQRGPCRSENDYFTYRILCIKFAYYRILLLFVYFRRYLWLSIVSTIGFISIGAYFVLIVDRNRVTSSNDWYQLHPYIFPLATILYLLSCIA